jgi:hypothetical protein
MYNIATRISATQLQNLIDRNPNGKDIVFKNPLTVYSDIEGGVDIQLNGRRITAEKGFSSEEGVNLSNGSIVAKTKDIAIKGYANDITVAAIEGNITLPYCGIVKKAVAPHGEVRIGIKTPNDFAKLGYVYGDKVTIYGAYGIDETSSINGKKIDLMDVTIHSVSGGDVKLWGGCDIGSLQSVQLSDFGNNRVVQAEAAPIVLEAKQRRFTVIDVGEGRKFSILHFFF